MPKVAVGKKVPDFALPQSDGESWRLSDHLGKKVVLYFYPKDMTPGCTTQGQQFRDLQPAYKKARTLVLGVSRDTCASHTKFRSKEGFQFDLLSDTEEKACKLFDVIHEKNMYGKKVLGIVRSTFLIDEEGKLAREWRKVKVDGHAEEVLEAAKSL